MFTPQSASSFEAVIPPFILTSIFLIAAIVIAQKMSSNGGSALIAAQNAMMSKVKNGVTNTSRKIATTSGRAASYFPRQAARTGINRAGNRLLKGFDNVQAKTRSKASETGAGYFTKKAAGFMSLNSVDRVAVAPQKLLKKPSLVLA
ncbi:MAG: hypothetical protein R3B53_00620 [Candidatus Paceibacterota bacterium]